MRYLRHGDRGMAPTPSAQRLRRGLPGYLILFAPHAFAPQRQLLPRDPPSPPVFLLISAHFTATPGISVSPAVLQSARIDCRPEVEPRDFTADATNRLQAFFTQQSRTTLAPYVLPRLLARSWPVLLLQVPSLALRPWSKRFTTRRPSSPTRRRCFRLSPIAQYSPLLPPVGVWAVSQSQLGRSPSQPGYPSTPW